MFVFPAFNSEFKNRKRTFKCCKSCRARRIKCKLSTDYDKLGCDNCALQGTACDLIAGAAPVDEAFPSQPMDLTVADVVSVPRDVPPPLVSAKQLLHSGFVFTSDEESARALHFVGTLDPTFLFAQFNPMNDPRIAPIVNGTARRPFLKRAADADDSGPPKKMQTEVDENLVKQTTNETLRRSVGLYIDNNEVLTGLSPLLFEYLQTIDAFSLNISQKAQLNLIKIYFYKVNSVFPLLDENDFWGLFARNCVPTVLKYAIVVVACRDPEARDVLLAEGVSDTKHYTSSVETKIRSFILFNVELNQLTLCRTYALLSLHERASVNGTEKLSTDLAMAIHIAISLGIHHKNAFRKSKDLASQQKLWWTIFVLDRLNAIINTRNMSVHRKDISVATPKGEGLARLVLVAVRLEKVLSLYQPHGDTRVLPRDVDFDNTREDEGIYSVPLLGTYEEESPGDRPFEGEALPCYDAPREQREEYVARASRNLRSLLNNIIIILAQKRAYENPSIANSVPDEFNSKAASKVLTILNTQTLRFLPNTPLIPYAASITLTAFLRMGCFRVIENGYTWREPVRILSLMNEYWFNSGRIAQMSFLFFRNLEIRKYQKESNEKLTDAQKRDMWRERGATADAGAANYNNNAMNPPLPVTSELNKVPKSLFDTHLTPKPFTLDSIIDHDFSIYSAVASRYETVPEKPLPPFTTPLPEQVFAATSEPASLELNELNDAYTSLFELLPNVGTMLGNFDYDLNLDEL
ncbi:hypothetical protein BABINDRAFT_163625 [Babjeviella inositovora NRRL Y-12698]|uniref:Xylanolytic transcriptional activator regulatory domain-containing protein n=1 Tax=Babjeviella inositovora NRRL Y-12698 TaxID=984486 RepID=A0A1E3QI32_9ASCO|nr:uncharacterized protein BABINDRAFT_163625 [Babjeviella inositovora NRRL Y-12698]ODQ77373.1 hypothetical protein BABINDRAFT_163625 [Babjeviella inositovora NRRL Y-12698]